MIYTKKGDNGKTSLFEPDPSKRNRVSKSSPTIRAIGAVDELNSYLGVANAYCKNKNIVSSIEKIQEDLFQIGAIFSNAPLKLEKKRVIFLEAVIDEIEENLPPLKNFILPKGNLSAVHFMYARSICRRAERQIVSLSKKTKISPNILPYINRLSDLLFVIFRLENSQSNSPEKLWHRSGGRKS